MVFLVKYDRLQARLESLTAFEDSALTEAQAAKLQQEIDLNQSKIDREIVLLDKRQT